MDESARPEATVIRIDPRCTPTGQQPSESSQSPLPTKDVHAIMQTKTAPIRSASEGTEMDITKVSGPNTAKSRPTSHLALNLVCTLKLDRVAASVARFDATSGEKINRMRKSYDNHLKQLGLAGKNKSTKDGDLGNAVGSRKMMSLSEMGGWPEEEWWNQKISGRDVHHGISEAVKSKLENAFHLNPGLVPDATMWEDILGIDRPTTSNPILRRDPKLAGQGVSKSASANTKANLESHHPGADQHPIRARRNTKKRRYDDGSFEGYGEGFLDDEMELEGYDSSETHTSRNSRGSKGEKNKRRKIQEPGRNHAQLGSRGSRTGSSTFGR